MGTVNVEWNYLLSNLLESNSAQAAVYTVVLNTVPFKLELAIWYLNKSQKQRLVKYDVYISVLMFCLNSGVL